MDPTYLLFHLVVHSAVPGSVHANSCHVAILQKLISGDDTGVTYVRRGHDADDGPARETVTIPSDDRRMLRSPIGVRW